MTDDALRAALRALIDDWHSVPRNGFSDEEGRARHETESDCADALEDALAALPDDATTKAECGCPCNCHADEGKPEWPGSCEACCNVEWGPLCECSRRLANQLMRERVASPATGADPEGLDVAGCQWWAQCGRPVNHPGHHVHGRFRLIAAEYARLAPDSAQGEPE